MYVKHSRVVRTHTMYNVAICIGKLYFVVVVVAVAKKKCHRMTFVGCVHGFNDAHNLTYRTGCHGIPIERFVSSFHLRSIE